MTVLSQLALVEATLFVALGCHVLGYNPRARENRAFGLLAAVFALWLFGWANTVSAATVAEAWRWHRLAAVGWTFGPVVVWHFFGELTRAPLVRERPWVVLGGYAVATLLFGRQLTDRLLAVDFVATSWGWAEVLVLTSPWALVTLASYFVFTGTGLLWVWRWGRGGVSRRATLQADVVLACAIPVLLALTTLSVVLPALGVQRMPDLGPLVLPFWGAGMAYAIARYRMLTLSPELAAERILRTMGDAVVLLSPKDRILGTNPAAARLFGATEQELVGRSMRDFLPDEPSTKMRRRVAGGSVYQSEVVYRPPARKPIDLSVTAALVFDDTEDLVGTVLMLRDVSARKEMTRALAERERHFRTLIENASDVIVILDAAGSCTYASPSVERVLGRPPSAEEARAFAEQVHPDDVGAFQSQILPLAGTEGLPVRLELRFRHQDGSWRILELVASALQQGAEPGILLNARDVTARKQIEQQLARAEREQVEAQLTQANRLASVGLLAAGVAHEVNNPLTYVIGNLELLAEELPPRSARPRSRPTPVPGHSLAAASKPAAGRRHVTPARAGLDAAELGDCASSALRGALRIERIIGDLRRFSRGGADDVTAVELAEVVDAALDIASTQLKYRAHVVRDLGPLVPVVGNEGKLGQVVLNLLVNAAQAIPEGQREANTVTVRGWSRSEEVVLEIEDTGRGIAPEHLARIFEPFYTTKGQAEGSGLGLWIVRNILKTYGATIDVRSEVGHGTTVTLHLPAANAAGEATSSEAPAPPLVSTVPTPAGYPDTLPPISRETASPAGRELDEDDDEGAAAG